MNEEKQRCWSCLQYNVFYIKHSCHFLKKDMGYCAHHKKIVDEQDCCEQWMNGLLSKNIRKRILSQQFSEIIHKLSVIEKELKEEVNVNEL